MKRNSVGQRILLHAKRFILPALLGVGLLAGAGLAQGGETVPFKSKYSGHLSFTPSGGFTIEETGIATHVGNFTLVGATDATRIFWFTMTAASGDEILGFTADAAPDLSWVKLVIYDGTGRFEARGREGAFGNFTACFHTPADSNVKGLSKSRGGKQLSASGLSSSARRWHGATSTLATAG